MEQEDDLKMKREVVEIEGGRKLYSYTFGGEGSEDAIEARMQGSEEASKPRTP